MRPVKLSATGTVDLDKKYFEDNDIIFIPNTIIIDGKEYIDDYVNVSPKFLYDQIRAGKKPTTSANNSQLYLDYWKKAIEDGYDIVHIDISSGLSAMYQSVVLAANQIEEEQNEKRVYAADSLSASAGEGLLLDYANDLKNQGLSAPEICELIEKNRLKLNHWFTLSDLTHLYRGGRINMAQMLLGSTLNIYPIMKVDENGKLVQKKKARGPKKALNTLVEIMEERAEKGLEYDRKVFISNSDCIDKAEALKELIIKKFKNVKSVEIFDIHQIGVHTGPGTIALFFWGTSREVQ